MRMMDIFQSIPGTLMAITVVAALGTGIPQLVVALALSNMPMMAKTVRAAIFTVRGSDYIESSRAIGAGNLRLMLRHMLPNAVGHIIIYAVGSISGTIMVIATLSYIGLGIQPPTPEWGALLNAGKSYISSQPYMVIFPGLMIMIAVLSLNLFGNGLRDALDPRLK
jgi:peptide/nickel transport system permease protein